MIEARASHGGVFAIGALILDTGHWILDKLNNFCGSNESRRAGRAAGEPLQIRKVAETIIKAETVTCYTYVMLHLCNTLRFFRPFK